MTTIDASTVTGDPAVVGLLRRILADATREADRLASIGGHEREQAEEHLARAADADEAAMAARAYAERWRRHLEYELGGRPDVAGEVETEPIVRGGHPYERPVTPDAPADGGGTVITMQRCCNGCGRSLGDATDQEVDAAMNGVPLPDVRGECPDCTPGSTPRPGLDAT